MEKGGFRLALGRTVWHLIGTEGTEAWLAQLARILELERWSPGGADGGQVRKLIFWNSLKPAPLSTRKYLSQAASRGLDRDGWTSHWINPTRIWTHPDSPDVLLEIRIFEHAMLAVENMIKACFVLFPPLISEGGLVLHAALVERNGLGLALVASGGVGKSTCARRLPTPWKALCDDTCLILPNGQGGFRAHPFATWSDYLWNRSRGTWKVESHVPLQAVFFLKHSKDDCVQSLGPGESSIYLSRSSHEILAVFLGSLDKDRARVLRQEIFSNACAVRQAVPGYWLEVNLNGQFWTEIEKVLG